MTAKRGTQWKTSWRRQKPGLGTAPQPMWFFGRFSLFPNLTGAQYDYEQALPASIGDTAPPFWIGSISASSLPGLTGLASISRGIHPGSPDWKSNLEYSPTVGVESIGRVETSQIIQQVPVLNGHAPPALQAVVQMLVVEPYTNPVFPFGPGFVAKLWVDGSLRQTEISLLPYNPNGAGRLFIRPLLGFINSMAGGNALPTDAEIRTWFSATRYALPFPAAQEIPGKTLDRYDAALTPGVVPAILVNQSTGQNADLTVVSGIPPAPLNLLVDTTFGY